MKNNKLNYLTSIKTGIKLCMLYLYLLCGMPYACAAGLGYLNIKSTLDKPFAAELEVIGNIEPNTTAELASFDEYTQEHIDYNADLADAELKIIKQKNKYIIRITTKGNFNEPVVNLLVKLSYNGQTIKKSYTKFMELSPASDINTARVVDNSINPIADLISPTASLNITNNSNSNNYSDIQISNNKKVILNQTQNNPLETLELNNANTDVIRHSGTIYLEKTSDNRQVNSQQIKKEKSAEKNLPAPPKNNTETTKKIEISAKKSAKIDAIPLSSNKKAEEAIKEVKKESNNPKKESEKKIPDIQQKIENKPTLKLDEPSAVDLLKSKTLSERQIADNLNHTDLGLGIGNSSPSGTVANNFNKANPNASNTQTDNKASGVLSNSKNLNNKLNNQKHVGIFEIIKTNIITSSTQPWFYFVVFIFILLLSAIAYIIYLKKQFTKNIIHTKEQLQLLQEQVIAYTEHKNEEQTEKQSTESGFFTDDDREYSDNEKKRKRKRSFIR